MEFVLKYGVSQMTISPTLREQISQARHDFKIGVPIALRTYETWLVAATETLSKERLGAFGTLPDFTLAITHWRAQALKLGAYDGDLTRIKPPQDASHYWFQAMAISGRPSKLFRKRGFA